MIDYTVVTYVYRTNYTFSVLKEISGDSLGNKFCGKALSLYICC